MGQEKPVGASVIDGIQVEHDVEKTRFRCPRCEKARIKRRTNTLPIYRCDGCAHKFDDPLRLQGKVTTFRTRHDAGWIDLGGRLAAEELRKLCLSPNSQLSIRELDFERFQAALGTTAAEDRMTPFEVAMSRRISGGHRTAVVRVRIGQGAFRNDLLAKYGDACAFTGPTPRDALDAAHLYSYAADGRHQEEGGLLMRRDIHRLFDVGHIAVHPEKCTVDVTDLVRDYPLYGPMHGTKFKLSLRGRD
ncbi:HNH endonuclease [Actinokineospora sp. 24-640]